MASCSIFLELFFQLPQAIIQTLVLIRQFLAGDFDLIVGHLIAAITVAGDIAHEGHHAVVVVLRDGIDLVIVATRAVDRQCQEGLTGRRYQIVVFVEASLQWIGWLVIPNARDDSSLSP